MANASHIKDKTQHDVNSCRVHPAELSPVTMHQKKPINSDFNLLTKKERKKTPQEETKPYEYYVISDFQSVSQDDVKKCQNENTVYVVRMWL